MPETFRPGAVPCPSCGKLFEQREPWAKLCLRCYLKKKSSYTPSAQVPPTAPVIEPGMLRRLIQLAHPDRHGNSEAATLATAWLLKQREVQRG